MLLITYRWPGGTPGILGKGVGLVNRRQQTNNLPGLLGGEKPGAEALVLRTAIAPPVWRAGTGGEFAPCST